MDAEAGGGCFNLDCGDFDGFDYLLYLPALENGFHCHDGYWVVAVIFCCFVKCFGAGVKCISGLIPSFDLYCGGSGHHPYYLQVPG